MATAASDVILEQSLPRYIEIKRHIVAALRSGALKPGDRVPSEAEIVEQFGVSRMTANRALRELSTAGIIVRRAGAGSYIAEPKPIGHMIEIRNIAEEIRARGHSYRSRVLCNEALRADPDVAELLGVRAGTRTFHSMIVHHEAKFPIQLEKRLVLAAAAPDYGVTDFNTVTPNEYLTRVAPLERVEHRVAASMPDAETQALLGMAPNVPVLVMTRRTWSRGLLVSHAWLTHPADRYELSATFAVDAG
ncbi:MULTISPECIES: histidine utilization repressor [unclassified Sphingomonas]|uniref:histidine utilization repressor n=1 Tax=unclassified Sphingomonas TaxID=196159 RepID=UPI00083488EE|nr:MULTISPECIES: histidine utilization repressor [unclassified Sphingomonas]